MHQFPSLLYISEGELLQKRKKAPTFDSVKGERRIARRKDLGPATYWN